VFDVGSLFHVGQKVMVKNMHIELQ
jgi:hypothetical protein